MTTPERMYSQSEVNELLKQKQVTKQINKKDELGCYKNISGGDYEGGGISPVGGLLIGLGIGWGIWG